MNVELQHHDKLQAASFADMAVRRCDNPTKAVAVLMMAALVVAESLRDEQVAYFHFVASIKSTFGALADATLEHMAELKADQRK